MAFFGIEDHDDLDDAAFFQNHVDVLGTHARLGQLGEPGDSTLRSKGPGSFVGDGFWRG